MNTGHFEAKKHAVRQTQDGWVVSFVVHPNDMSAEFATAPLGTRYMVGFAAIGDDEQPTPVTASPRADSFAPTRSEIGKQRYALSSDMKKALVRAARLSDDARFHAWVAKTTGWGGCTASDAASYIRDVCCIGESRKLIAEDRDCYDAFIKMETTYLIETGVLAEPR